MENPLLSIVCPVYNVAPYLKACLQSLLTQEFHDFELILVDDGSSDGSGALCDQAAAKDTRVRVFHQANHGLSGARNRGIESARGEYLAFVDSDDTVSPELFAENIRILQQNPSIDLLEFPIFVYYGAPEAHLWRKGPHDFTGIPFEEWFRQKGYAHTYACNKIYRRKLFGQIRFPEGKIFEDLFTIPQIIQKCTHYYLSDKGIYYYYAREGSISRTENFNKYHALFESNYRLWQMARKNETLHPEAAVFSLELADWLASMGRLDIRQTYRVMQCYESPRPGIWKLLRMAVPLRQKLKNLPLALFGRHVHCLIYTCIK